MHLLSGGSDALSLWRRFFRRLDALQRRRPVTAVPVAVAKKYSDDRGGSLAALVAFYGFLAVFPLLLLFVTIAGIVLANNPAAEARVVHSALSEFPVVGDKLAENISALHKASGLAFAVSFVGLLWGSLGVTNHLQEASATMWDVPRDKEPNLVKRVGHGLLLLGTIAAAVIGSAILAGIATIGHLGDLPIVSTAMTLLGAGVVNVGAYLVALHILAPAPTRWRSLLPGTLFGGIGWTLLEVAGSALVGHVLRHATHLYGFFATVLGLVFWLSLGSQLFVYAAETNVVLARRLWPRHLDDPPPDLVRVPASHEGAEVS